MNVNHIAQSIKRAAINGDNTTQVKIVSGVSSKKIRVLGYVLSVGGATQLNFQSDANTPASVTVLTGLMHFVANGLTPICAPFNPVGWFETVQDEALYIKSGSNESFDGHLVYIEV